MATTRARSLQIKSRLCWYGLSRSEAMTNSTKGTEMVKQVVASRADGWTPATAEIHCGNGYSAVLKIAGKTALVLDAEELDALVDAVQGVAAERRRLERQCTV